MRGWKAKKSGNRFLKINLFPFIIWGGRTLKKGNESMAYIRNNCSLTPCLVWFFCGVLLLSVRPVFSEEVYSDSIRLKILEKADRVLINNKLCSDANDCTKKRLIFASRKKNSVLSKFWGVHLESFEIKDIDVVSALMEIVISEYYINNRSVDIDADFYMKPHREMMGLKKLYVDPFITIKLKGIEK